MIETALTNKINAVLTIIKFALTNTTFLITIKSINEFTKKFLTNRNFECRSKVFCFTSIELKNLIFCKMKSRINSSIEIDVDILKFELFESVDE